MKFRAGRPICYGGTGGSAVTRSTDVWLARIAVAAGFAGALALSGCGRKSGLDEPPVAAAGEQPGPAAQPSGTATSAPDGKPAAPPAARRTPLVWLLN